MRRLIVHLQIERIVAVNGLIGYGVVVEALHYVDFAAIRPAIFLGVERQQPDGGPCSASALQLGAHFYAAAVEGVLAFAPYAAGEVVSGVGLEVVVHYALEHQAPVAHLVAAWVGTLSVRPVGFAAVAVAPSGVIDGVAVEFVLPHKLPSRFATARAEQN